VGMGFNREVQTNFMPKIQAKYNNKNKIITELPNEEMVLKVLSIFAEEKEENLHFDGNRVQQRSNPFSSPYRRNPENGKR